MKNLEDYLYYEEKDPDIRIYHGDCLEIMPLLPKVDLVVTDPPYGMISSNWDSIVDFPYQSFDGAIVFASMPFTAYLCEKNKSTFRHHWVWDKVLSSGFQIAKYRPMKQHEDILVFGRKKYFPIMKKRDSIKVNKGVQCDSESSPLKYKDGLTRTYTHTYPSTILSFSNADRTERYHPTQKPKELLDYLLRTYSESNETILDPFLGSGTTLVACKELNRNGIGIEINEKYCEIAKKRLKATCKPLFTDVSGARKSSANENG